MKKISTKDLALIGVMTAALCVVSPFSIPIPVSPVPISLATFVVYLSVFLLGSKKAVLSSAVYLLIGLVGVPVFSGFSGGPAKLLGPTGGYLIGYLLLAWVSGVLIEHFKTKHVGSFVALVVGTLPCYALGTLWLAAQMHLTLPAALMAGVIPYIPADVIKMVVATVIGVQVKKQLLQAGMEMTTSVR